MKDRMILAIASRSDGKFVALLGLTPDGFETLSEGLTLTATVPSHMQDIAEVIVLAAADTHEVMRRLQETGAPIYDHTTH